MDIQAFVDSLPIMLYGMIGIFAVIAVIYFIVFVLNRATAGKKTDAQ